MSCSPISIPISACSRFCGALFVCNTTKVLIRNLPDDASFLDNKLAHRTECTSCMSFDCRSSDFKRKKLQKQPGGDDKG
jgi:hypothetical protein